MSDSNSAVETYPRDRGNKLFSLHFVKTLFETDAAQHLSPQAIALVTCIAAMEDRTHFRQPVRAFNEVLCEKTGLTKHSLPLARETAVQNGWLHYQCGGKSKAGTYWVLIPDWASKLYAAKNDQRSLFRSAMSDLMPENRETSSSHDPGKRTSDRMKSLACLPKTGRQIVLPLPKTGII